MMNVCTHAGDNTRLRRLFRPAMLLEMFDFLLEGDGDLSSSLDGGDAGGFGSVAAPREPDRLPLPDSSRYGVIDDRLLLLRLAKCSFSSSSASTSFISSPTPLSFGICNPSLSSLAPNTKKRIAAPSATNRRGSSEGTA